MKPCRIDNNDKKLEKPTRQNRIHQSAIHQLLKSKYEKWNDKLQANEMIYDYFKFVLVATNFTTQTFKEKEEWRKRNKWKGCVYGSPKQISIHLLKLQIPIFVLELNIETKQIVGIGKLEKPKCHTLRDMSGIYSNQNYNRYMYINSSSDGFWSRDDLCEMGFDDVLKSIEGVREIRRRIQRKDRKNMKDRNEKKQRKDDVEGDDVKNKWKPTPNHNYGVFYGKHHLCRYRGFTTVYANRFLKEDIENIYKMFMSFV